MERRCVWVKQTQPHEKRRRCRREKEAQKPSRHKDTHTHKHASVESTRRQRVSRRSSGPLKCAAALEMALGRPIKQGEEKARGERRREKAQAQLAARGGGTLQGIANDVQHANKTKDGSREPGPCLRDREDKRRASTETSNPAKESAAPVPLSCPQLSALATSAVTTACATGEGAWVRRIRMTPLRAPAESGWWW